MVLMLAEVLRSCQVAASVSASQMWSLACYEQSHAAWVGASLHDLIQPGFYFLVGTGLCLSLRRRVEGGQSRAALVRHTLIRTVLLILFGMALTSVHPRRWTWSFVDTLTQIGLAYPFVFAIARRPKRDWLIGLVVILLGYWMWFALSPLPPSNFDYGLVGVSPDWLNTHGLSGFSAHWQKNSNPAWAFDRWFLNLFPGETYTGAANGLTTLNFIPSIGTMILGLFAGDLLTRENSKWRVAGLLCGVGMVLLASGWGLGAAGVAPVVKPIWTPSWVLFSGGWCFLFLAGFTLFEGMGLEWALFPLCVVGQNSLVAYAISHLYPALAYNSLRRLFGDAIFVAWGPSYEPFVYGCAVLLFYWMLLFVLYRRRIFLRL
jgi:predicted acyltransferase